MTSSRLFIALGSGWGGQIRELNRTTSYVIVKALTQLLVSLAPLLRHLLNYGSVCIGEGAWLQSGWAFEYWKPWVVPERMTAGSVSHGRQQFVLCFRHGLAKPRGLCWVIISIMEKLLGRPWRIGFRVGGSAWAWWYPNGQFDFKTLLQFGLGFEYSGKPHSR